MARDDEQVNIRVSAEAYAVLAAAAYVRGLKSPNELVRPHIDQFVDGLRTEPAVRLALKAQEMQTAEAAGRLKHLPHAPRTADAADGKAGDRPKAS